MDAHNDLIAWFACSQRYHRWMHFAWEGGTILVNRAPTGIVGSSALDLVGGEPEDAFGGFIASIDGAVRVQQDNTVLHGRDHRAIALFTLAEGNLGFLPLGDVQEDRL